MNEGINEFIGKTKEQMITLFNRVEKLEYAQDSLKEITLILKLQQEQNAEQHKVIEKINANLTDLNTTVKGLQVDMDNVKEEVSELKDSGWRKFNKEFFYKVLPSVLGTLLVGYIVWRFGIK